MQFDHKVLAAVWFDSLFCYSALRSPLAVVTTSSQQKVSPKNTTQVLWERRNIVLAISYTITKGFGQSSNLNLLPIVKTISA